MPVFHSSRASRVGLGAISLFLLAAFAGASLLGQTQSNSSHPGIDALLRGDYDMAIVFFTRAIARDPDDARIYNDRGVAYREKGDLDHALSDYNEALSLEPRFAEAYNNRANLYLLRNQCDLALTDFSEAITINPQYAEAYAGRGKAELAKGNYRAVILDETKAIQISPENARFYKTRADAYLAAGLKKEALADYHKADSLSVSSRTPASQPEEPVASDPDKVSSLPGITSTAGLPTEITILNQQLELKNEKVAPDGTFLAEYIPSYSDWNDWTLLFGVRYFPGTNLDAAVLANHKLEEILKRKVSQPLDRAVLWRKSDGLSAIVDFSVFSPDFNPDAHSGLVEHNFWLFRKLPNGVVSYQIARRVYSAKGPRSELVAFVKGISQWTSTLQREIENPQLPIPNEDGSKLVQADPWTFQVQVGDDLDTVRTVLHLHSDPSEPDEHAPAILHQISFHVANQGIWLFFDRSNKLKTLRFDAPFSAPIANVKIGESMENALDALGQPNQPPWRSWGNLQAYSYSFDSKTTLRVDMDASEGVQHLFLISVDQSVPLTSSNIPARANLLRETGSGAFITSDGVVLTAAHVVAGATRIEVQGVDGRFSAQVVKTDSVNDVALLQCQGHNFDPVPIISSRTIRLAQNVFTIGFPDLFLQGYDPKFTEGVISSDAGLHDDPRKWQISVPIQKGSSGGPLCDQNGNLIGIIVGSLDTAIALRTMKSLPQDVNFAVKSDYILPLVQGLKSRPAARVATGSEKIEDTANSVRNSTVVVLVY